MKKPIRSSPVQSSTDHIDPSSEQHATRTSNWFTYFACIDVCMVRPPRAGIESAWALERAQDKPSPTGPCVPCVPYLNKLHLPLPRMWFYCRRRSYLEEQGNDEGGLLYGQRQTRRLRRSGQVRVANERGRDKVQLELRTSNAVTGLVNRYG
jgi:hypothetical protein